MQPNVKLTLRIPPALHKLLQNRARQEDRSLNMVAVETLRQGLSAGLSPYRTERERVLGMLRENGLVESPSLEWENTAARAPRPFREWRELLKGVTLSDAVVEERESQP